MRFFPAPAVLCLLSAGVFIPSSAHAQFNCAAAPNPGKSPQNFRGALRLGQVNAGDIFQCGTAVSPTPGTCTLFNRVYTDWESACTNAERQFNGDYLPTTYGSNAEGTLFNFNYETDIFSPANWPLNLGVSGQEWYIVWEYHQNPTSADCIGYYAASSDMFLVGETGNHRKRPCDGGGSLSCVTPPNPGDANACHPQISTPFGDIANIGGLGAVPVPVAISFLGTNFDDPALEIEVAWQPPCAATTHDAAPFPLMGYRLEVFPDANGNGTADILAACDLDSSAFVPLLDIAPVLKTDDAIPDILGSISTSIALLDATSLNIPGLPNPADIESLTFRLRILYQDDRLSPAGVGGVDGIIDPIVSLPSARASRLSLFGCLDADGDGFGSPEDASCVEFEADCDDTDPAIYPGAPQLCDGINNNCRAAGWPAVPATEIDDDGDSWVECDPWTGGPPVTGGGDCDDSDPAVHPGVIEGPLGDPTCADSVDNDCDGMVDNADPSCQGGTPCPDGDADGFADCLTDPTCDPTGLICGDCDDAESARFPGNLETCDNQDNNCDTLVDEGFDFDADGFTSCDLPIPDCDDGDPANFPGNPETCDNQDNNCDTVVDEGFDVDADGVTSCDLPAPDCNDADPSNFPGNSEVCDNADNNCDTVVDEGFDGDSDGFTSCDLPTPDCDDTDPAIFPGAAEGPFGDPTCGDGTDNDCDGFTDAVDPGCADTNRCPDADGDGVADCTVPGCDPAGLICGDCDDANPGQFPGNIEICDGQDNDCNALVDDGLDADGDGVSDCVDCAPLVNSVSEIPSGDGNLLRLGPAADRLSWLQTTNSNVANLYRGTVAAGAPFAYNHACFATEVPDTEIFDPESLLPGDLHYYLLAPTSICGEAALGSGAGGLPRPNSTPCALLGNDTDIDGVSDIDDNCPLAGNVGQSDGDGDGVGNACDNCAGVMNSDQADREGDGVGDACDDDDADGFFADVDCDDTNPAIRPGAVELCDLVDNNCDGQVDEGFPDTDADRVPDCLDPDDDADMVADGVDNCPLISNPMQEDMDGDGLGDPCDDDTDGDGFLITSGPGSQEFATGEIPVAGTVTGTLLDSQLSDDIYQVIEEEVSSGSPSTRFSFLEHKWVFTLTEPAALTLHLEAHHTANAEGDDILVSFSTDDVTYTQKLVLTKTADDDTLQSIPMPAGILGPLYIRAVDADQTGGNSILDSLFVDRIFVQVQPFLDCDDQNAVIFPGNTEVCDNLDNNCDMVVDEGFDLDGDGVTLCDLPVPDCDDADPLNFPGNTESCDNLDNDCDAVLDNGFDLDGDGVTQCALPVADCDDSDPLNFPGQVETCDGQDNNCDTMIDEGFDLDGDGTSDCQDGCPTDGNKTAPGVCGCGVIDDGDGDGVFVCAGDCDDSDGSIWTTPGETQSLTVSPVEPAGTATLTWTPPVQVGATTAVFDTIRSTRPDDFVAAGFCVETDDGIDTTSTDPDTLVPGDLLFYLVRTKNACPAGSGIGQLGSGSDGIPRAGVVCVTCNDNGTCEPGESCSTCPNDCDSKTNGPAAGQYCCGDGIAQAAEGDGTVCDGNF